MSLSTPPTYPAYPAYPTPCSCNTDFILLDGEELPDGIGLPKITPGFKNRLSAMRLLNLAATSRQDDFRRLFNRASVGRETAATVLIWAGYDVESLLGWT